MLAPLTRFAIAGRDQVWAARFHEKTDLSGANTIYLSKEDAAPLVEAGLFEWKDSQGHLTREGLRVGLKIIGYERHDVRAIIDWTLERALFQANDAIGGETAIPALYDPSPSGSRLVLVLGENAGGKSMFRRVISRAMTSGRRAEYGDPEIPPGPFPTREILSLSMQGRTNGQMSSMIYGMEAIHSTGYNSAHVVLTGIKTAHTRLSTHVLYWDEPDIGMSARVAAGAGEAIRALVEEDEPLTQAIFVTSHSPALVARLAPLQPHYVYLGDKDGPPTLADWFESQRDPKPLSLEELQEIGYRRFKLIQQVLGKG